jgi:uncharacterized protein YcbX
MSQSQSSLAGRVSAIWRYPVKSMRGEELQEADVSERGLLGDRAFALVDPETGKVVSAKNPRRWPNLFDFRAAYAETPGGAGPLPAARVTLPGGGSLTSDQPDAEARLSDAVGRPVLLSRSPAADACSEGYWPDHDWLPARDQVFEFPLPQGTFFDCATVNLVTTATLERLRALAPTSRMEIPRFRPNFVIESPAGAAGFVENDWVGRTLDLGGVRLRVDRPCARCVMTTLRQEGLPADPAVLRAAVQGNSGHIGVYATVMRGGRVCRGDVVARS